MLRPTSGQRFPNFVDFFFLEACISLAFSALAFVQLSHTAIDFSVFREPMCRVDGMTRVTRQLHVWLRPTSMDTSAGRSDYRQHCAHGVNIP